MNNYRPISVLLALSKVFEKAICRDRKQITLIQRIYFYNDNMELDQIYQLK